MKYTQSNRGYPEKVIVVFVDSSAVGEESRKIVDEGNRSIEHYLIPSTTQWKIPEIRFSMLKDEWESDTLALSSITEISLHPAYQQIIGMGPVAIPMILNELSKAPNHWFWALKSITGEDPVPLEARGRTKKMVDTWLEWGRHQGYISE